MITDTLLQSIEEFAKNSLGARYIYEDTWAQAVYTMQGTWVNWQREESQIRGVPKSKYRLVASTMKDITAAIYTAFLKDKKTVQVVPTGNLREDELYATVYDYVLEVYSDHMRSNRKSYLQHQSAIENAFLYGFSIGRFRSPFGGDPAGEISYEVIPPELLLMDWRADTLESSEAIIIEHRMNAGEWIEFCQCLGYHDDGIVTPQIPENSALREARLNMPNKFLNAIPELMTNKELYIVWECYLRSGRHWNRIYVDGQCRTTLSPLEPLDFLPLVGGYIYYVAHRAIGDMLVAWASDAEDNVNGLVNARMDNLSIKLQPPVLYPRGMDVDIKKLKQNGFRAGEFIFADDPQALRFLETPDVTQTAYLEASVAEGLLSSLAGLPKQSMGTSGTPAETISQIYQSQAKKLDLILGTWSETYWEAWHRMLLRMICRYAPDSLFERGIKSAYGAEKIFSEPLSSSDFRNLDPLRVTLFVTHTNYASQERAKLLMEMATQVIQSNNASMQLYQQQLVPRENLTIVDPSILIGKAMNEMGIRGVGAFTISREAEEQAKFEAQKQAEEQQQQQMAMLQAQGQQAQQAQAQQMQQMQQGPQQFQEGDEEFVEETIQTQPDGTVTKQRHKKKMKQGVK